MYVKFLCHFVEGAENVDFILIFGHYPKHFELSELFLFPNKFSKFYPCDVAALSSAFKKHCTVCSCKSTRMARTRKLQEFKPILILQTKKSGNSLNFIWMRKCVITMGRQSFQGPTFWVMTHIYWANIGRTGSEENGCY